jgi:arginine deiminase
MKNQKFRGSRKNREVPPGSRPKSLRQRIVEAEAALAEHSALTASLHARLAEESRLREAAIASADSRDAELLRLREAAARNETLVADIRAAFHREYDARRNAEATVLSLAITLAEREDERRRKGGRS